MTNLLALTLLLQGPSVFDQGAFLTSLNGKDISREGFRILDSGKSASILSSVESGVATVTAKSEFLHEATGLVSATVNMVGGASFKIVTEGGALKYQGGKTVSTAGKPIYALESFCWHNFTAVLRAAGSGSESRTFQVLVPSERLQTSVVVKRVGDRTEDGVTRVDWTVTMDGTAHAIVSDEAGRIHTIDIDSKGLKVKRLAPGTGPTTAPSTTGGATNPPVTGGTTTPTTTGGAFPIEDPTPMMPNRDKYTEREGRVFGAGAAVISGTLTFPKERVKHPAVVLISGAGASDRNWNSPPLVSGSPAAQIADRLGAAGYCSFRFDDRGVGKSTGRRNGATFWQTVSDARSLVAWVKGQPEVDPFRIVVAGHGEGALIAFILAAEDPTIAGVVSFAGPSKSIDKVIMEHLNAMSSDENLPVQERDQAARMIPKMTDILARAKAGERGIVEGINLEWLREHMAVNPLDYVARLRVPFLIVQGLDDNMTLSRNGNELKDSAEASEVDTTAELIARMSHFLMQWPYNNPEYDAANPNLLVAKVHDALASWLNGKIKG